MAPLQLLVLWILHLLLALVLLCLGLHIAALLIKRLSSTLYCAT